MVTPLTFAVPAEVIWVPLRAETVVQQRLAAALTRAVTANGQVLVIGNSYDTRGRQQMASQTREQRPSKPSI
ncbi:hypothetical protein ECZU18_29800 [Escherichia coli]|nr:hypothetical protein ECZU18_29800 [Escherichia coli]